MTLENVEKLAKNEMKKQNLIGWGFGFNNRKSAFGLCSYTHKKISLSKPITELNLNNKELILNVVLHEIAHAIDYTRNGTSNHGKNWQIICYEIGYIPNRSIDGNKINLPKSKYTYVCPNCGATMNYNRKLKTKSACGYCCDKYNNGKFSEKFVIELLTVNY